MTTYVDPHHVTVIVARAREEIRALRLSGQQCGCEWWGSIESGADHFTPGSEAVEECFPHLVLGLLQPTVTAYEPVF